MHFLKQIFLGEKSPSEAHEKFVRYGKGEFEGSSIKIKKYGDSLKIKGSINYVNIIGEILLKNTKEVTCSGKIYSKDNPKPILEEKEIEIKKEKKKKEVSSLQLNKGNYPSQKLLSVYEELDGGGDYLLLNLKSPDGHLKSKNTLPKPGKVDKKFFSASLPSSALTELEDEVAFDLEEDFKKLEISHLYHIEGFEIPEEYKGDYEKARIHAKRKGKIERNLKIDGEERKVEKEFKA